MVRSSWGRYERSKRDKKNWVAMNFQQLKHFVHTAEIGNILKAAEQMHISQSGLSRSISALEHQLGLALFERSAKGVELTMFGRHFYPRAKLILNEQRRSVEELKAFRELRAGSLTVGMNHTFAYFLAPDIMADLLKGAPDISISVMTNTYQTLTQRLLAGEIDMALSLYTRGSMRADLRYETLLEVKTRVYASPDHPLASVEQVTAQDLAKANWALVNGASVQAALGAYFARHDLAEPNVSLRCASIAMLAKVVAETQLLTMLPEQILSDAQGFGLAKLPFDEHLGIASLGIIQRVDSPEFPIAERFAKLLRKRITDINAQGV